MSPLLTTDNVTLHLGERTLCQGLRLQMAAGECWALLGMNGAGKTTLLHTLAGLRHSYDGLVSLDGLPLPQQQRRLVARRIGLLPQDTPDPFPATVLETALLGRYPFLSLWEGESAADRERAREALEAMELGDFAHRSVATLSGGERRRLAFALLLVQDPGLWLLDEPTNHLDLRHQALVLQQVRSRCAEGACAMMSLHDPNLAARYASKVLLLFGNGEWEAGTSEQLLTPEKLSHLYRSPIAMTMLEERRVFVAD